MVKSELYIFTQYQSDDMGGLQIVLCTNSVYGIVHSIALIIVLYIVLYQVRGIIHSV